MGKTLAEPVCLLSLIQAKLHKTNLKMPIWWHGAETTMLVMGKWNFCQSAESVLY